MSDQQQKIIEAFGRLSVSTVAMILIGLMLYLNHQATLSFHATIGNHLKDAAIYESRQAAAMELMVKDANMTQQCLEMIINTQERLAKVEASK